VAASGLRTTYPYNDIDIVAILTISGFQPQTQRLTMSDPPVPIGGTPPPGAIRAAEAAPGRHYARRPSKEPPGRVSCHRAGRAPRPAGRLSGGPGRSVFLIH